jgi:hypothetical protein
MGRARLAVLRAMKARKAMKAMKKAMKATQKTIRFLELWTAEQQRVLNDSEARMQSMDDALVAQRDENKWMRGQIIDLLERMFDVEAKLSSPAPENDLFGETTAATAEPVTMAHLEDVYECLDRLWERTKRA